MVWFILLIWILKVSYESASWCYSIPQVSCSCRRTFYKKNDWFPPPFSMTCILRFIERYWTELPSKLYPVLPVPVRWNTQNTQLRWTEMEIISCSHLRGREKLSAPIYRTHVSTASMPRNRLALNIALIVYLKTSNICNKLIESNLFIINGLLNQ